MNMTPDISPLGSKGIGVVGVAPAIANAVFATGRRIRHLPIMPEHLL